MKQLIIIGLILFNFYESKFRLRKTRMKNNSRQIFQHEILEGGYGKKIDCKFNSNRRTNRKYI